MHSRLFFSIFLFSSFVFACAPTATSTPEPKTISVYATPAAQPWLMNVYDCAPENVIIKLTDELEADLVIRLGEPDFMPAPVYQIDTEEVLVVTNRQSPVQNITVDEVRELFAGQGDPSVVVWVYASGDDVQRMFEQAVMQGRSVTSLARLAVSPQHMSDTINNEPNTVGILPRHWKAGDSRFVYTIKEIPVLLVVKEEPQGAIQELIACLQK